MREAVCFITSALAGMGVGGGGLFTVFLSLTGTGQLAAQGMNLFSYVAASAPASFIGYRRYAPDMRLTAFLSFCACVGCMFGAMAAPAVPDNALRRIYGAFTVASGIFVLFSESGDSVDRK